MWQIDFKFVILVAAMAIVGQAGLVSQAHAQEENPLEANFAEVAAGDIPTGWSAPDSVAVQKSGDEAWLEAVTRGQHTIQAPLRGRIADFDLEMTVTVDSGAEMALNFRSGDAGVVPVKLTKNLLMQWDAMLGEASKAVNLPRGQRHTISLQRRATRWSLEINGKPVIAKRFSSFGELTDLQLVISGPADVKVYSLVLRDADAR